MKTIKHILFSLLAVIFMPDFLFATNGLNLIGFGAESISLGGADLAVSRDSTALVTNPAGLTQIPEWQLDLYSALAYPLKVAHRDSLGNDKEVSNRYIVLGDIGYVRRLPYKPVVLGIGLFSQGGAGNVYKDINTPFGTKDEFSSSLRIANLTPGIGYTVNNYFSLGASFPIIYTDLNQKVFPETSFDSFFGYKIENIKGANVGYRLGIMGKINNLITIGAGYSGKTDLVLKSGKFISNMTEIGLGKITYRDVKITGLNRPQELGIGMAINPRNTLISLKINWIDWSEAMDKSVLSISNPDNPAAPSLTTTSILGWRDQIVWAIGLAHELNSNLVLRGGYNYGKNPIPNERLNPLLAAFSEHTITAGAGYRLSNNWGIDFGVEYDVGKRIKYTNPDLPFGPDSEEESEVIVFHFMFSFR